MAFFSNSHFIFLDYSEIVSLNPYPGIVKKKNKIFLNAFLSSEPFTFIFSWYLSRLAQSWFDGRVSAQPTDPALVWGHVQYRPGDGLDELKAPFTSWFSCFYLSVWLKPAVFPPWPTSLMTFKGQSLRLQVVCDLCLNKWSYSTYPASKTSLHKSWTKLLFVRN